MCRMNNNSMGNSLRDHHVLGVLKLPRVKLSLQHVINPFSVLFANSSLYAPFHSHGRADVQLELVRVGLRRELRPFVSFTPPFALPSPSSRPLLLLLVPPSSVPVRVSSLPCSTRCDGAEARVGLEQTLGASFAAFMRSVQLSNPYFSTSAPSLGSGFLLQRMRAGGTVGLGGGHRLVPLALELELALAICAEHVARHFPSPAPNMLSDSLNVSTALAARLEVVHAHLAEGIDPQPTDHEVVHPGCRRQQVVHVPRTPSGGSLSSLARRHPSYP